MTSEQINRVTLFKISDQKAQEELLSKYKQLQSKAVKDGKPYIISAKAGRTEEDQRNQGYTIVAQTTFADKEGFEFYDKHCEAHAEIREYAKTVHQGVLMVYFKSVV
ncbi:hypothetical protein BDZ85DRAFT_117009 [Elsinoe ampelina]|uniref:Stress-response A/B barrel domain-containing protein n=1 Tax=Elsinoe ampelina TaxID=302913 RepID=A0A6A6FY23_9PEZI|nr:hypothetical protein BDZ85DRAFT_117009 [Elsinoe ampelina]